VLEQPFKFDRHALLLTYPGHLTLPGGQALLLPGSTHSPFPVSCTHHPGDWKTWQKAIIKGSMEVVLSPGEFIISKTPGSQADRRGLETSAAQSFQRQALSPMINNCN